MSEQQQQRNTTGRVVERPYILVAPNGARRGHADHPTLPVTLDEIVRTVRDCYNAGAQGLHLHIRDEQGQHALDSGQYLEAIDEVQSAVPQMDIQITTEAAGVFDVQAQFDCLRQVRPTWASISVREIARAPEMAGRVYGLCAEQGTRVQHILYNADDATLLEHWQSSGTVRKGQVDRLLVLGRYATGQESVPKDLDQFPADTAPWMVCAFGSQEHMCLQDAAQRGGDVRVGFENSLTGPDGQPWADNAASVAALVSLFERTVK
ncbi:3-keto-5-aminohexanoate cleavage protein [Rhodobacteraceae bacterium B1Z28]|uniref:3-keto-5-aminohexanoate cleavage protein n=1 Tax=Ruegeria haliotis TaxID=2747601 RepID=A0ABX2PNQ9_9RHOB|nr:3-keto-5-aminohexanoate cleavage protein [Ruegeria haliotis]NVO55056.1 3-keto-5-aminohexanoate cleavage protein [Ruegeria haliotis]